MNTAEHLNAIKAKCLSLLAIAEKRTPGRWSLQTDHQWIAIVNGNNSRIASVSASGRNYNAAFIASAAGPFEAALRSTIAAIEILETIHANTDFDDQRAWGGLTQILAAWPLDLL